MAQARVADLDGVASVRAERAGLDSSPMVLNQDTGIWELGFSQQNPRTPLRLTIRATDARGAEEVTPVEPYDCT